MKKNISVTALTLLLLFVSLITVSAQRSEKAAAPKAAGMEISSELNALVVRAVDETLKKYAAKNLKAENLAVTLVSLKDPDKLQYAEFRGEEKIYPASVVKLFYLAAVHQWLKEGKLKDSPELQRALKDMIIDSSNDATHYIVDALTGTSSGIELSEKELKAFSYKRHAVNRYFEALGYKNINACQKTFCEDIYGRDNQFRGKDGINRNKLTTNATARLMTEIVLGKAVDAGHSRQMMELLKRDFEAKSDPSDQAHAFTALALKPGMKLWSKAGWTSTTRHDAAYVETPNGQKFVLVIFTTDFANEKEIIPDIVRRIIEGMK